MIICSNKTTSPQPPAEAGQALSRGRGAKKKNII
jgi:hypothetical protein